MKIRSILLYWFILLVSAAIAISLSLEYKSSIVLISLNIPTNFITTLCFLKNPILKNRPLMKYNTIKIILKNKPIVANEKLGIGEKQADTVFVPTDGVVLPAEQLVHSVLSAWSLYVLIGHSVQTAPPSAKVPAGQDKQEEEWMLNDICPDGHCKHLLSTT